MTDMTIEQLQEKFYAARNACHEASVAKTVAFSALVSAKMAKAEADLASLGIVRGIRVFDETDETRGFGIYVGCKVSALGSISPDIRKIKKDGTAHPTASVWFGSRAVLKAAR